MAHLFKMALLGLMALTLEATGSVSGFPSIFSRPRLFQHQQQQQQQQQQPQQPIQQQQQLQQQQQQYQHDQLLLAANSLAPSFNPFGLRHQQHGAGGFMQPEQHQIYHHNPGMNQQQREQEQLNFAAQNHFEAAQAAFGLKPSQQQQQPLEAGSIEESSPFMSQLQPSAADSHIHPLDLSLSVGSPPQPTASGSHHGMESSNQQRAILDKIESHIGQQIEQSLNDGSVYRAAASNYQQPSASSSSSSSSSGSNSGGGGGGEEERRANSGSEKEASASGEEAEGAEEPVAEKRNEESKEHQHEEHPPEAFEVHHKKGGKSFQYFHQGHHH